MTGGTLDAMMLGALALLLVSAGIEDARSREISNWKNATILLLAPFWWWAHGLAIWPDVAIQLGVATLTLAFFWGCFHFGWMGGGDVKMIAALALWFPAGSLAWMLIVMSLVGGGLTLLLVTEHRVRRKPGNVEIPYGVAIAIAALLVIREPILNHFGVNA
jgi:prepilin peptidase CpaA